MLTGAFYTPLYSPSLLHFAVMFFPKILSYQSHFYNRDYFYVTFIIYHILFDFSSNICLHKLQEKRRKIHLTPSYSNYTDPIFQRCKFCISIHVLKKTIPASNAGFLTTGQSPCSSRYAYNA